MPPALLAPLPPPPPPASVAATARAAFASFFATSAAARARKAAWKSPTPPFRCADAEDDDDRAHALRSLDSGGGKSTVSANVTEGVLGWAARTRTSFYDVRQARMNTQQ